MWQFSRKSDKRKFDPLFKTLLIKRDKNEDVNEKKKKMQKLVCSLNFLYQN